MGDIADYLLDTMDYYEPRSRPLTKVCRYCKLRGLTWILQKAGWRLSENGRTRHICPAFNIIRHSKKKP